MSLLDKLYQIPEPSRKDAAESLRREFFKSSLYHTAKYLLGYSAVNWRTHGAMIHALQSPTLRKLLVMPRGTFKTSIGAVAYPIWRLNQDPNLTILIDSELYANSKNTLREIKQHLESERLTAVFGPYKRDPWNEGEITIRQRTEIRKEASITVSGIGAQKTGQHYDCLHGDTLVLTSNGFVKARELRPGLRVYSDSGKFERVLATQAKLSDKNIIAIRAQYQAVPVRVTSDHKILVWRDNSMQWIEATSLRKDDMLAIPKIKGSTRTISRTNSLINELVESTEVWRLIGYWLGDGCATADGAQIRITFGTHKTETIRDCLSLVQKYLKVPVSARETKSSTTMVCFSHSEFKEILLKFGTHAKNKHLPPFAMNSPRTSQLELLRGYFACDGSSTDNSRSIVSISHNLLTGFQLILASMDIPCGIAHSKEAGQRMVVGNLVNCQDTFTLSTTSPRFRMALGEAAHLESKPVRSFFTDKHWVVPIRSLERESHRGEVYDIQVENNPTFYCPGVTAHNCIIFDDMNSPKNSNTPEALQKVVDHYRMYTSILNPGGTLVGIGTRYSAGDLIGFILKNEVENVPKGLLIS